MKLVLVQIFIPLMRNMFSICPKATSTFYYILNIQMFSRIFSIQSSEMDFHSLRFLCPELAFGFYDDH